MSKHHHRWRQNDEIPMTPNKNIRNLWILSYAKRQAMSKSWINWKESFNVGKGKFQRETDNNRTGTDPEFNFLEACENR